MNIFDNLRIKFETPVWGLIPELAVIDHILETRPDIITIVKKDILEGLQNNNFGRHDGLSVEQVVRAGIYKEIKNRTYDELYFDQYDSIVCKDFLHLSNKAFSRAVLQKFISKISSENLNKIMIEINKIAAELNYEDFKDIRTDSTPVEADIQRPTNNSLVYDCIKSATRFFEKMKDDYASKFEEIEKKRKEAKKINYELNNVKGQKNKQQSKKENRAENMRTLFVEYLDLHKTIHEELNLLINNHLDNLSQRDQVRVVELEKNMTIIYNNAYRFQIDGIAVKNEDKIFSIYETHTDIIVKGIRDIVFGHKINLTSGRSNLILYCKVEDGNPADSELFEEPILEIEKNYDVLKFNSTATDGGYASLKNRDFAKEKFVNVIFTKSVGSLQNIFTDKTTETELKKWRAGAEGVISNLKRKFNLGRVLWKGKKRFDAKIFWSVLCYNIRVLTSHILGTIKEQDKKAII